MKRLRLLLVAGALGLAGCPGPVTKEPPASPTPAKATPEPKPTPTPPPYVPAKRTELGKVFNGMQYKVTFETEHGTTAATERKDPASYSVEVVLRAKVPKPNTDLASIQALSPKLPEVLPALPQLVERAQASPFFDELYRLKCANIQTNLNRLDVVLSRLNFYDCETILELQHPETKRRALLVQSDMDVDEDGSDPERVAVVDSSSLTYQPFTSYRWMRKTDVPNPFLAGRQQSLEKAKRDAAAPGLSAEKTRLLKAQVEDLNAQIYSLTKFSFLVGAIDPFIVLPASVVGKKGPFSPAIGDFCVIVAGDTLFPAVVGDAGPTFKMGEASMRICREINSRASSINSATSELKITYLVFPGTAERPFTRPDLVKWREKCAKLLEEMGGAKGELFTWTDLSMPPAVAATPTPMPAPALPSASGSPTPMASPTPAQR